jgi:antibiotic biosynthesis monooxygenase (ABM) superfamily enzyme
MYGTIARLKVRKDKLREFFALGKEWDDRDRKRAIGYLGSEILWEDKEEGRACLVVRFSSREMYMKNASSPEQDAFYKRMRACLEADPEWIDGEYGRWDDAHARPPAWAASERS